MYCSRNGSEAVGGLLKRGRWFATRQQHLALRVDFQNQPKCELKLQHQCGLQATNGWKAALMLDFIV